MIFKREGPRQCGIQIHAPPVGDFLKASEASGGVTRIHGVVAIAELRTLTGGAAFGITLTDENELFVTESAQTAEFSVKAANRLTR